MTQTRLDFTALARSTDPLTSHVAASHVDLKRLNDIVVRHLKQNPAGLTSHEIAEYAGLSLVTISPRMKPLEQVGLVQRSGKREGRTVWKFKPSESE